MTRELSKKTQENRQAAAHRFVFAPTLLCLALLSATSAMAARSGGYNDVPRAGSYGNVESLTGNQVQITEENDLYEIYGAIATHETMASVSENTVTISGSEDSYQSSREASSLSASTRAAIAPFTSSVYRVSR